MEAQALHQFTSHINGKNAVVTIYPDRVEWLKPRGVSGGKVTAGIMTAGLSMLATGVKNGKSGTEMIPIKAMSSVTTRRDGMLNSFVSVITTGNTVDFRVSHKEAAIVKETLTRLMLGTHDSQSTAVAPEAVPAPNAAPDIAAQLHQLAALRDAGILTDDEFSAKKAQLLERL
ncbi:SHOCT domain-containing protein [Microbacterium foliorum]|uniref:SHOCT domain-containing protein n=1 Tax=Microbacterium foliorum TaxID=104336 RepID=UPI0028D3CDA0|nr:SHOCT domain-containing protein [Microbacterium foliorum]